MNNPWVFKFQSYHCSLVFIIGTVDIPLVNHTID